MRFTVKTALTTIVALVAVLLIVQGFLAVSNMRTMRAEGANIGGDWLPSVRSSAR